MTMRRIDLQPLEPFTSDFIDRTGAFNPGALEAATAIIEQVRRDGDAALRALTEKFDGVAIENFRVPGEAIDAAMAEVDPDTLEALKHAAAQIRDFHERQKQQSWFFAREDGAIVGSKVTPLESVGIYVPGGRALYPSTVLMNALPAQVAGVERIVCVTPPTKDGTLDAAILAACKIAGVTEIYTVGGAQAVAALAYGTETIRPVAKITGPGNAFVAAAKKLVSGDVGIDMIAGPSEVCVVADETADPRLVAIDLMAQAEHDPLAACYLVTFSDAYADAVEAAIQVHLAVTRTRSPPCAQPWIRPGRPTPSSRPSIWRCTWRAPWSIWAPSATPAPSSWARGRRRPWAITWPAPTTRCPPAARPATPRRFPWTIS